MGRYDSVCTEKVTFTVGTVHHDSYSTNSKSCIPTRLLDDREQRSRGSTSWQGSRWVLRLERMSEALGSPSLNTPQSTNVECRSSGAVLMKIIQCQWILRDGDCVWVWEPKVNNQPKRRWIVCFAEVGSSCDSGRYCRKGWWMVGCRREEMLLYCRRDRQNQIL